MSVINPAAFIDFNELQRKANDEALIDTTEELREDIAIWNKQLVLLRGDNIYDVARLFWSARGQHSLQLELNVDIPHGSTEQEAADLVTDQITTQILAPVGYRMIRTLMGRQIVNNYGIVGALVNPGTTSTKATYDVLGLPVFCLWFQQRWNEVIAASPTPYLTRVRMASDGSLSGSEETIPALKQIPNINLFYPNMTDGPEEVWRKFAASNANVLLLIGPPGTGKSNFILQMMAARGWDDKINLIDRDDILLNPGLADWIRDRPSGSVVITEDSDKMVMKRTEGNAVMSAILNTTAGIVQRDLKLIISTNLPTVKDVDEALIRAGRCYDILTFTKMTSDDAHAIRDMMEMPYSESLGTTRTDITLAEAINAQEVTTARTAPKFGFN